MRRIYARKQFSSCLPVTSTEDRIRFLISITLKRMFQEKFIVRTEISTSRVASMRRYNTPKPIKVQFSYTNVKHKTVHVFFELFLTLHLPAHGKALDILFFIAYSTRKQIKSISIQQWLIQAL